MKIQDIISDTAHDCLIVAGDLNCEFNRNTPHVFAINEFIQANNMRNCREHVLADVPFTFESKGFGTKSIIDHVIANVDLFGTVVTCNTIDTLDNISDHVAVSCVFDMNVAYFSAQEKVFSSRPSWQKAGPHDIVNYQAELDRLLSSISLPMLYNVGTLCAIYIQQILTV